MDLDTLTPAQRRVVDELMDWGNRAARPRFDPDLPVELRDTLEASQEQETKPVRSEEEWVARFMEEFDAEEIPGEWDHAQGTASEGEELEAATSEEKGH